jgi:hypothetical protein
MLECTSCICELFSFGTDGMGNVSDLELLYELCLVYACYTHVRLEKPYPKKNWHSRYNKLGKHSTSRSPCLHEVLLKGHYFPNALRSSKFPPKKWHKHAVLLKMTVTVRTAVFWVLTQCTYILKVNAASIFTFLHDIRVTPHNTHTVSQPRKPTPNLSLFCSIRELCVMWNLITHFITTLLALQKKLYDRTCSDNVTSQIKGAPNDTDRILTTDDEYTDVQWIPSKICKTPSYTARNNN